MMPEFNERIKGVIDGFLSNYEPAYATVGIYNGDTVIIDSLKPLRVKAVLGYPITKKSADITVVDGGGWKEDAVPTYTPPTGGKGKFEVSESEYMSTVKFINPLRIGDKAIVIVNKGGQSCMVLGAAV
jgi:hypothetical protein